MALTVVNELSTQQGRMAIAVLSNSSDYYSHVGGQDSYLPATEAPITTYGVDIRLLMNWKNIPIGQSVEIVLSTGAKIKMSHESAYTGKLEFINKNGVTSFSTSTAWSVYDSDDLKWNLAYAFDDATQRGYIIVVRQSISTGYVSIAWGLNSGWLADMYLWAHDAVPFISSFVPVANLYSTNGNTPLTMVKQEYVNEGLYIDGLSANQFTRFTTQSNFKQRFLTLKDGEKQILYYCASNPVYITRLDYQIEPGVGRYYKFALSYSLGGQPEFISQTFEYSTEGNGDIDLWFAFLVDEERRYAHPSITVQYTSDNMYSINEGHTENVDLLHSYYQWLASYGDEPSKPNPFEDNPQNNDPSGGVDFNEKIDEPNGWNILPTLTGIETNFFKVYNPTLTQLNQFAAFLWSDDFLDTIKKLFGDPVGAVLGLSVIPVAPHTSGVPEPIKCGNVTSSVMCNVVDQRFVEYDMGSIVIKPTTDSYLDFSPNTKIEIYLPFCGTHQLDTDDIMQHYEAGKSKPVTSSTLTLRYIFDVLTGAVLAQIAVNGSVHYQYTGSCSGEIPINSQTYDNMLNAIFSTTSALATTVATQGAAAPMLAGSIATNINALKPSVEKAGNIASVLGMMSLNYPYITITQPILAYSENEHKYKGYPSYMTRRLSQCSGYTKVFDCHVEGMSCTEEEKSTLLQILKGGVIL